MTTSASAARRREIDRTATEVRMDDLRRGLTVEETANRILRQCPEVPWLGLARRQEQLLLRPPGP